MKIAPIPPRALLSANVPYPHARLRHAPWASIDEEQDPSALGAAEGGQDHEASCIPADRSDRPHGCARRLRRLRLWAELLQPLWRGSGQLDPQTIGRSSHEPRARQLERRIGHGRFAVLQFTRIGALPFPNSIAR